MSNETEHVERRKLNSLTTPDDNITDEEFKGDQDSSLLTNDEVVLAMDELNNTAFVERFPHSDRRYADPEITGQAIGLFSFVPAKGATPNKNGIYGFAKLRGNYASSVEANTKAEEIIRKTDSYHQIYHTFVGKPFPVTESSDYSSEVNSVDLRKDTSESFSEDIKLKREKDARDMAEIKEREESLLEDVKKDPENESDPDHYTTLHVKKAQLTWMYVETLGKIRNMQNLIAKARLEIHNIDIKEPTFRDEYKERYMKAREASGLSLENKGDNFMKFLVEDIDLPEIDALYDELLSCQDGDEKKE